MKRKIFSKLLMGALLVASVSSFTSCKDYDDDIKKNTDDISALTKQISTLETALNTTKQEAAANYATKTEIAKLATAEALQNSINDLQAKVQGNSSKTIAELANDIDAINPKLNTLGTTLDNIEKAAQAAIKNIELQQTVLDRLQKEVEGDGSSIAGLKDDVATLKDEVAKVKTVIGSVTSLDELAQKMTELSNKIDDSIDVLTVLVSGSLKSLVFQPDHYFGGIEATEAAAIFYTPLEYSTTVDYTYKKTDDKDYNIYAVAQKAGAKAAADFATWIAANDVVKPTKLPNGADVDNTAKINILTPYLLAKYHMNPSTVKKENIKEVSVISDDKIYLTRAAASKPEVKSWDAENGILTAQIGLTYKDIAKAEDKVTVFAAQAHYKDAAADTTITSDYAAVSPVAITNLVISDNAAENSQAADCSVPDPAKKNHVWRTATDAINAANKPAHSIAWNSTGFDLSKVIEVHYDKILYSGNDFGTKKIFPDQVATAEQLKHWGLALQYSLVEYTTTTNKTEQTLPHMTISGSVVTPTGIKGDQTNASIGRQPLVKIELVDTNNKNVLAQIGYVKFEIVADKADAVSIPVSEGTKYWTCNGVKDELTWDVVEGEILTNTSIKANGISKTTFEMIYGLDLRNPANPNVGKPVKDIPGGVVAIAMMPYIKVGNEWKKTADVATYATLAEDASPDPFTLVYGLKDGTGTQTNIITLNLTSDRIRAILAKKNAALTKYLDADGNETTDLAKAALDDYATVEIAGRLYDVAQSGKPDVYVVFKYTVSKLALTINKIADYWYAENNVTAKSGVHEIHISVPVIGETGAVVDNFKGKFQNTVVKNNMVVAASNKAADQAGYVVADLDDAQRAEISTADYITTQFAFVATGTTKAGFDGDQTEFKKDAVGNEAEGVSGQKYLLVPNIDGVAGKYLYAIKYDATKKKYNGTYEKVAYIDNVYSATNANFVLSETESAKDLVNFASHKDLANTLTAHVKVSAKLKNCDKVPVLVTNPAFDVKFLRPLDIEGTDARIFQDATDGGNVLELIDLIKFNDWREQWAPKFGAEDGDLFQKDADGKIDFTKPLYNGAAKNYFNYYKVSEITFDYNKITTDLNNGTLGETLLKDVTTDAKFTAVNPTHIKGVADRTLKLIGAKNEVAAGTGDWKEANYQVSWNKLNMIKYENNQTTVGTFKVRVPVTVTYFWGTQSTTIDLTVSYTKEN